MQIDFHHAATYVCARLAGFSDLDAGTIAYAAQYVDDATNSGTIRFDNGEIFQRMSSAHKLFDYRNFRELANYRVWLPFHFLPGNGGLPAGQDPPGGLIDKLICRPNSPVAQDMVRECLAQRQATHALHRLGITMHVYADTWAHQGFAGVNHRVNEAQNLLDGDGKPDLWVLDRLKSYIIGEALPLGHGAVLSNPDKPFKVWSYTNGEGQQIQRHNPQDFLAAIDHMYGVMRRFLLGDPAAAVGKMGADDRGLIGQLFVTLTDNNQHVRHQQWITAIAAGKFSFGPAKIRYVPKGAGSWKYVALGTLKDLDQENEVFHHNEKFHSSNWKLFHDALQAHHAYVMYQLLPQYGIAVA